MKRLYHVISGLAGGVLLLAGCEGDTIVLDADPVAPEATTLSVTSDNPLYSAQEGRGTLRFKTPGGEVVFSVETNAETWSYTNDNEAWLAVEQNEYDGTLTLRAQRNEEASEPAAEVVVMAGEGSGARTWTVEVVQNASYVYARSKAGVGGLPVGSSGRVVSLLSSGIDSPVASWRMARRGAIVIGLAAVIIGEVVFSKIFHNFALKLLAVVIGAILYYIVIQVVLWLGLNTNDLKMLQALVVAMFLAVPYWKHRYVKKKGDANHG